MKPRKAQKIRDILFVVGILIMVFGILNQWFFLVGAVVELTGLYFHYVFNKCPHCGTPLGKNHTLFCEKCGCNIDTGK